MALIEIDTIINAVFRSTVLPGFIVALWLTDLICLATCKICILVFVIIFIVLPLIFKFSFALQKGILFLTFITYPPNLDLKRPEKSGLYATRNFYITYRDQEEDIDVDIAVWHVLPNDLVRRFGRELQMDEATLANVTAPEEMRSELDKVSNKDASKYHEIEQILARDGLNLEDDDTRRELFEASLKATTNDIVLYLHGNSASRGASHRVDLYKLLRSLNYHVITLDYRGYGDSANLSPTERGVVYDSLAVYQYITSVSKNPVYLWGHSLGTGVATHLLSLLTDMSMPGPRALVLESPFNNIREEICAHPFSKLYRHLPWFDYTISKPMYANELRFESDQHIAEFRQPVLILHAEDDHVVPFHLGYKLYRTALDTRGKSWGPVEFHRFERTSHYGHRYICRAPNLPEIVIRFFRTYRDEQY
ncbi:lysophosphatidylserine lipase ABHD12 isoform X1 [Culex quinquefasciatus]|uniref:lysophosphatidylserine lipase ABHD12 isoform X1 n=1 Tax=Culex quinquefasciatus TaxID=7176 RepID=UPI0018E3D14A|nr:lysophosphatidylserine lipase ABHD12 isoform X1 [Culex quinquefasciatus]XP_038109146.1 lysophosphatidylserine lipase ABHD12 isoform X1 [Culex quinquefasciatus]XP_038109147.1 lysophosphatidylserine lipase ABHD12 isoform X1 [Culex quinquefasciatus]XP_038109148.1 lysophosphatidylserine lipase ABHD12 isoform X1 [Culex quinquefasciatus]